MREVRARKGQGRRWRREKQVSLGIREGVGCRSADLHACVSFRIRLLASPSFPLAKIAERLIRLNGFEELFDSLSTEGNVDKNTLVVVIVILSSGELEDKLKELQRQMGAIRTSLRGLRMARR